MTFLDLTQTERKRANKKVCKIILKMFSDNIKNQRRRIMKKALICITGICIIGYLIISYTWMIGDIKRVIQQKHQRDQGVFEMLQK